MENKKSQKGFSLVELLIYIAITGVAVGVMTGVLTNILKVQVRESASTEISNQLNFITQTIQRLVRESSLIDMGTGTSSVLKLRMAVLEKDPTYISLENNAVKIKEGTSATTTLTNDRINVNSLSFHKFSQYPGHDTVQIDIAITSAANSQVGQELRSGIARVSASTFDSDLLPGINNSYDIGVNGTNWKNLFLSGELLVGANRLFVSQLGNVGIGTASPNNLLQVSGLINFPNDKFGTFVGYQAGQVNTGSYNTFVGYYAGKANTTGVKNTFIGHQSGISSTSGSSNIAIGVGVLNNNTGNGNIAIGGDGTLTSNISGSSNIAIGGGALNFNTSGGLNTAIGLLAGQYQANGTTPLQTTNNSIYIGYNSRGFNNSDNNSIVIGANAIGIGANSVVLGSDGILTTALKGSVGIGTTIISTGLKLDVEGKVGATEYCDQDGNNCKTITAMGGGTNVGAIVQTVTTQTGAVATGITTMPSDDTVPQITEGNEYMTVTITPENANNELFIEVIGYFSSNLASRMSGAIFQDTTLNALASGITFPDTVNQPKPFNLSYRMLAGITSSTTFKFRAGTNTASTVTFNGASGARIHGGVINSIMRVTEIRK
ncbi:MAG: prepilin-type N-terminal cleavage/methylation domain-containing protein [Patescibacteria group bacterium]